ncbi:MAG: hypothetical protein JOZ52_11215, partial [Acidobacteria bacterium]|nr:hypothetical protein [Acidobacteriota bacterium]
MKRVISFLIVLSLLTTIAGSFTSSAQQQDKAPQAQSPLAVPRARSKEFMDKLPPSLQRGATPEAKAAWDKLTPEQRAVVKAKVDGLIETARADAARQQARSNGNGTPGTARKSWKEIIKARRN